MEDADPCPFCGGEKHRKGPLSSRLKEVSAGASPLGAGTPSLDVSAKLRKSDEVYYTCNGCMMSYVDAERDIAGILRNLKCHDNIAYRIKHYYGDGLEPADLLTKHRTAIVRKTRRWPTLNVSASRKELIICFLYDGIRTYGSFVRKRGHYVFRELSDA